jgi:hypothetical protein
MTRARDVADTQENNGGGVPPFVAGKNAVINGAMNFWQRGTSFTTSGPAYAADRWNYSTFGGGTGQTVTRQTTSDTTNLPFIQYCLRYQRNAASTVTGAMQLQQSFETVNSIPFAGKTVTLSFYARAGANYSSTSNLLLVVLAGGTGTDQNRFNGYTGETTPISQNATLTTTWQRFSYTGTVAATATELSVYFASNPTGTAGANDYYEITGVQLEAGSVATPFTTATGTVQGELAACQRYYWRNANSNSYASYFTAMANTSTRASSVLNFPVAMRIAPTTVEYANICFENYATSQYALSAVALSSATNTTMSARLEGTISGAVAGHVGYLNAQNSTSAYLAVSAEL